MVSGRSGLLRILVLNSSNPSLSVLLQVIESTQELGNDLAGVMALQRKLTGMERDLAAIEDKLADLGKEADRLASEHPEQSEAIKGRLAEITGVWDEMKVRESLTLTKLERQQLSRCQISNASLQCLVIQTDSTPLRVSDPFSVFRTP